MKLALLMAMAVPALVYADASLKTDTGFYYPTNTKHENSRYYGFGVRSPLAQERCHLANDYDHPIGTDVYATGPGVVHSASSTTPFYGSAEGQSGGTIIIKHFKADGSFFYGLYGHIQNISVAAGDSIKGGQKIAEVGKYTANGVALPHLHFGINPTTPSLQGYTPTSACNDQRGFVDPEPYLLANSPKLSAAETCQANNDTASTRKNTIVTTANVLANDSDTNNDTLTVKSADAQSVKGVDIVNNNDGTFTYTPAIDFTGTDSFNYTITDNNGCTDTATVTIKVNANNATPETDTTDNSNDSGGGSFGVWGILLLALYRRLNPLAKA